VTRWSCPEICWSWPIAIIRPRRAFAFASAAAVPCVDVRNEMEESESNPKPIKTSNNIIIRVVTSAKPPGGRDFSMPSGRKPVDGAAGFMVVDKAGIPVREPASAIHGLSVANTIIDVFNLSIQSHRGKNRSLVGFADRLEVLAPERAEWMLCA
jgi:hypothetical protein